MLMKCCIHDGCVTLMLVGKWVCGFHSRYVELERMEDRRQFLSMAPTMEAESEHRHYGSIELYASLEPSVGAHPVAFLQLLYNEVKSPQDNPLDSTVTLLQGIDSAGELAH